MSYEGKEDEIQEIQEKRLVIALDYGTTYTGVAVARTLGAQCDLDDIDVVCNWGPRMRNSDKVPSVITYSLPSSEREQQWGSDLSPEAVAMVHTKLELDVQNVADELDLIIESLEGMKNLHFDHIISSRGFPAYMQKSPEEIVTDYLTKVFQFLLGNVESFASEWRCNLFTDIVATIPTNWPYVAMNSTYRALTNAGFNLHSFPRLRNVFFITESEAAAVYTTRYLKSRSDSEPLKIGECFVLCDAGGGTVDVVSYRVKALQPTLLLEQVGVPTGRKCGSLFINMEFKKWLHTLLGDRHYRMLDPNLQASKIASHTTEGPSMRDLMARFEQLKHNFTIDSAENFYLDLPRPLDNLTILGAVEDGEITLTRSDMESFFDFCIVGVVDLIKGHFIQIERRGARVKNVFLVGGFGESQYLHAQLEQALRLYNIKLIRPDTSWTAVVQGAVICGIKSRVTPNLMKASYCRYNYGITMMDDFSNDFDTQANDRIDSETGIYDEDQMIWLLNKGDLVLSTQPLRAEQDIILKFSRLEDRKRTIRIFGYSDEDRPPRFQNGLFVACALEFDLGTFSSSEFERSLDSKGSMGVFQAILKLELNLNGDHLTAMVAWNERVLARETVPY